MSIGAVCSVSVVVPTTFHNISHVVGLCSTFEMVRVYTAAIVAFVSDDWWFF